MSSRVPARLAGFFQHYAAASLAGDADGVCRSYATTYVEAGPAGVEAFTIDGGYRRALAAKSRAMRALGLKRATVGRTGDTHRPAPYSRRHTMGAPLRTGRWGSERGSFCDYLRRPRPGQRPSHSAGDFPRRRSTGARDAGTDMRGGAALRSERPVAATPVGELWRRPRSAVRRGHP